MRICLFTAVACMLAAACTIEHPEPTGAVHQGQLEIHVDASLLGPFGVTRVTAEAGGVTQDLVLNESVGIFTFTGIVIVPAGTQTLVVRAFGGDDKVGESPATPVEVVRDVVTRVFVRILDLRASGAPSYGPILDSLSFPTTTEVGATATFAISVVAPVGDPVTYAWTSDCADATFTAPDAASTGWSSAAPGVCTISVQATSNGFTVAQSFMIIVFPAGAGGLDVAADFIVAPSLGLRMTSVGCFDFQAVNSSCPMPIASPDTSFYDAEVFSWGSGSPGTFELSDNCGGRFGAAFHGNGSASGQWLPPVGGGVCIITARAASDFGSIATRSAAILVRPGTPPSPTQLPAISASFDNDCALTAGAADCGTVFAGRTRSLFGSVDWLDGLPGSVTVEDSCAGPQPTTSSFLSNAWTVPTTEGTCITTVHATNLQGASSEVSAQYQVIGQ